MLKQVIFVSLSLLLVGNVNADPETPEVIKKKNSKCIVKSSGGEYPKYKVYHSEEKAPFFSPTSDGISGAKFSEDGKYLALTSSEVDNFGMYLVNCETKMSKTLFEGSIVTEVEIESSKKNIAVEVYSPMEGKSIKKSTGLDF
ncbi:MAG: hypothetical protein CL677_08995 [Bdellovibrionaceae bacterium]|nr:hypothetical protein [Pseudobdellovibrionaceae bacterium]|tara:strand:- start:175 stop:603 length:429 start_codon:yes stop_codon:yes gene_type:complete